MLLIGFLAGVISKAFVKFLFLFLFLFIGCDSLKKESADCPYEVASEEYWNNIVAHIEQLKSCKEASKTAYSCSLGGLGDRDIFGAARQVCEKYFLEKADADLKLKYEKSLEKCLKKYENEQGSVFISVRSSCMLNRAVKMTKDLNKF